VLVQTDKNSVIGGYMPEQWEDTTGKESSRGYSDFKDILSGSPFLFYWVSDEIQVIKHRDGIPTMSSDKNKLMVFGLGLSIGADQNSFAYADDYYWVYPQNTGNLTKSPSGGLLYFAGGKESWGPFKSLDVEVWSLN
jgi:hypothetical protein